MAELVAELVAVLLVQRSKLKNFTTMLRFAVRRGSRTYASQGFSTSPFSATGGDPLPASPVRRRAVLEERLIKALREVRDPLLSGLARAPDVVSQG